MSKELASWGAGGYPTKLRLKDYKGRRFVDVRKHYGDQPTRKGIMLSSAQYTSLLESLLAHADEIEGWFEGEAAVVAERVASFQVRLREARHREMTRLHNTEVSASSSPGHSLFAIEFRGADAVVTVNDTHPLVSALDMLVSAGDAEGARHILATVLQASFHAVALAESGDGSADLDAAEQHAHFLAMLLKQVTTRL